MQKLQIFAVRSKNGLRLGLCRNPRHLLLLCGEDLRNVLILSTPLSGTHAYLQLKFWERKLKGKFKRFWWHYLGFKSSHCLPEKHSVIITEEQLTPILSRIKDLLSGRLLSEKRLFSTLRQEGYWPGDISQALDLGVFRGTIIQLPGFQEAPWGQIICNRCNSHDAVRRPCLTCGESNCLYCQDCSNMGNNRGCCILLTTDNPSIVNSCFPIKLELTYELTLAQRGASDELLESWSQGIRRTLIWAACGAGKTEVTFSLIRKVLSEGGQVLFAIPRQAIVREMAERLRKAFPQVTVAAHYSGQPWLAPGNLVVATTHQTLHFRKRFRLVILDEVDAFPYQGNEMLRFGLQRALTSDGHLVEMTATPNLRSKYERRITIPARYHGYPVPEPQLINYNLPPPTQFEPVNIPPIVLQNLERQSSWLIFVPTIATCISVHETLAKVIKRPVGICHSQAPNKDQTIEDMKMNKLDVVVTTSLLERGVNFPGVEVMVLYADHSLFSTSALVQIAGRVGRSAEMPEGCVLFIGNRITANMRKARSLIEKLNNEARKKELLFNERSS